MVVIEHDDHVFIDAEGFREFGEGSRLTHPVPITQFSDPRGEM